MLDRTLDQVLDALVVGGRAAVISYHSGEDRIVKAALPRPPPTAAAPARPDCRARAARWRSPVPSAVGPVTAGPDERARNPRAASARLRAVEKIDPIPVRSS